MVRFGKEGCRRRVGAFGGVCLDFERVRFGLWRFIFFYFLEE